MTCDELERWLDLGLPAFQSEAAEAHARECRRCAAVLEAARELESMLAPAAPAAAPVGFTDRVMLRVAAAGEARAHVPAATGSPLTWWVRAAAEPASALALFLAGLVLWKGAVLWTGVAALSAQWGQAISGMQLTPRLGPSFGGPEALLGFAVALMPAAGWASWTLFRWAERLPRIPTAR